MNAGVPFICLAPSLTHMCLVCPHELRRCKPGHRGLCSGQLHISRENLVSPLGMCFCWSPASYKDESKLTMVSIVVLRPSGVSLFILLQCWGSFSSSISFFFSKCRKKSLHSHNKNKSVLYFTIYFNYFHYEAFVSPTGSRSIQHFAKTKAARDVV